LTIIDLVATFLIDGYRWIRGIHTGGNLMAALTQIDLRDKAAAACCVPLARSGMTEEEALTTAALFKALADPHRVRIVNLLATAREAVCVCDLTGFLGLSQPTVSFHMRKLVDAGLLARDQRGVWAHYSLKPDVMRRLGEVLRFEGSTG
jgi:ArsR family transcriptional regulator